MSYRILLFIIITVGIISSVEIATITASTSPYSASSQTYWIFFMSLMLALTAWTSIIWHALRKILIRRGNPTFLICIRQAALFSAIITLSLFFRSLHIFTVWNVAPLALAALLIEFFFQAEKKPHATLDYDPTI